MQSKPLIRLIALLLLAIVCTACGQAAVTPAPATPTSNANAATATPAPTTPASPSPTQEPLAAIVNGQPIAMADYERSLAQYEADLPAQGIDPNSPEGQAGMEQTKAWILDWMITEVLIEQAAEEAGVTVPDEEVDAYLQDMIAESESEEAFYNQIEAWGYTPEEFRGQVRSQLLGMKMTQRISDAVPKVTEHVHARHILVDTPEEAERLLAQLEANADFASLARAYSQDYSTRDNGGDLSFFPRGILVAPEVEEAAFSLQPGQISDVVESSLGYHIVKVVERDPAREVSPENLRLLQDRAVQEWIEGLRAQATIQRFVEPSQ